MERLLFGLSRPDEEFGYNTAVDRLAGRIDTLRHELAGIEGVRENQLVGYGIVVGLNGTGDKRTTIFGTQSLASMLQRMGVAVPYHVEGH